MAQQGNDQPMRDPNNINEQKQQPLFQLNNPPPTTNNNTDTTIGVADFAASISSQSVQQISTNLGILVQARMGRPLGNAAELLKFSQEWTQIVEKMYVVLTEPEKLIMTHQSPAPMSATSSVQMAQSPLTAYPPNYQMMGASAMNYAPVSGKNVHKI